MCFYFHTIFVNILLESKNILFNNNNKMPILEAHILPLFLQNFLSYSFVFFSLSTEHTSGPPPIFPPFFTLFPTFFAQNYTSSASGLDSKPEVLLSGSITSCYCKDLLSPVCPPVCALSLLATAPGEIPALADVKDGSSRGKQLSREPGERKTCVVSAAFTLAEKNGRKNWGWGTAFRVLEDQQNPPEPRKNTW